MTTAKCVVCGSADATELHHIATETIDPTTTVPACHSCHKGRGPATLTKRHLSSSMQTTTRNMWTVADIDVPRRRAVANYLGMIQLLELAAGKQGERARAARQTARRTQTFITDFATSEDTRPITPDSRQVQLRRTPGTAFYPAYSRETWGDVARVIRQIAPDDLSSTNNFDKALENALDVVGTPSGVGLTDADAQALSSQFAALLDQALGGTNIENQLADLLNEWADTIGRGGRASDNTT